MSTTLFLINPIVSKSGARLFAPNFWDDTNRRRRRNSTGRENNTARLVRPPPFHLQTSTTREGEPPDRVTAERERERKTSNRNTRTKCSQGKDDGEEKKSTLYSRAPLFSTTHISVGLDAMMMCFIGCECDEIRKVTIVFFFFSLRHHHREVASQPLISHPPLSFLLLFFVHTGFRVCVCVFLLRHTQKKGGKKGGKGKTKSKNVSMEGGAVLIVEERMYMM